MAKDINKEEAKAVLLEAFKAGMLIQDGRKDAHGTDWGHLNYVLNHKPYGPISIIGRTDLRAFWPHVYRVFTRLFDGIEAQKEAYNELREDVRIWREQALMTTDAARFYKGLLVEAGISHESLETMLAEYRGHLDAQAQQIHEEVLAGAAAKKEEATNE